MATLEQLERALVQADAAGNVEDARVFASEIKKMRGAAPASEYDKTPSILPDGLRGLGASLRRGMTFGLADEVGGAGRAVGSLLKGEGFTAAGEAYNRGKDSELGMAQEFQRENPLIGGTAQVLGGLASGGPVGWAKMAQAMGKAGQATPIAMEAAGPVARTVLQQMKAGAKLGAGSGAVTGFAESDDGIGNRLAGAAIGGGLGGMIGGAVPVGMEAGKKVGRVLYNIAEPWLNPAAVKGRAYLSAAGDKVEQVVAALRGANKGDLTTAGEAVAGAGVRAPEFSALQKSARDILPAPYADRAAEQGEMRMGLLRQFAGDEDTLARAVAARSQAADPLYKAARGQGPKPPVGAEINPMGLEARGGTPGGVDTGAIVGSIDDLLRKNPFDAPSKAKLLDIRNKLASGEVSDREAVSSAVDVLKGAIGTETDRYAKGQLKEIKDVITKAIPGFAEAERTFAKMSRPVGQMKAGQSLADTLAGTSDDEARQATAAFLRAQRDLPGVIEKATGFEPKALTDVMEPWQLENIAKVTRSLQATAKDAKMASAGAKAAPDAIRMATRTMEEATGGKVPQLFSRVATITNAIISRAEGKMNKKLATEMAQEMLEPELVAAGMTKAWERKKVADAVAEAVMQQQRFRLPSKEAGLMAGTFGRVRDE